MDLLNPSIQWINNVFFRILNSCLPNHSKVILPLFIALHRLIDSMIAQARTLISLLRYIQCNLIKPSQIILSWSQRMHHKAARREKIGSTGAQNWWWRRHRSVAAGTRRSDRRTTPRLSASNWKPLWMRCPMELSGDSCEIGTSPIAPSSLLRWTPSIGDEAKLSGVLRSAIDDENGAF